MFQGLGRRFWYVVMALLAANLLLGVLLPDPEPRLDVPYTTFRQQVQAGNVASVTSQGDTIQGRFKKEVTYPTGEDARTSEEFETERPAFADDELLQLLVRQKVEVNAQPLDEGRSFLVTLLLFFGPTLLIVALMIFFLRRAAAGVGGGLTGLGRSKAKRYEATAHRTTFEDVAGIEEAEAELVEIVDFLKNPSKYTRLGGASPRACCSPGRRDRQDAPGARRGGRGRRARSSRCRPRSSSRWWSASARAASGTCSTRRRRRRPRSSSSTSSTPSAGPVAGAAASAATTSASRP
jgi:cell division protease FtsH